MRGNSNCSSSSQTRPTLQPHVRCWPARTPCPSLQPRLRGNTCGPAALHSSVRSSPACAGNAVYVGPPVSQDAPTPRARGTPNAVRVPGRTSLQPRVRGELSNPRLPARSATLQPHVRGEQSAKLSSSIRLNAPTPRLRGTHRRILVNCNLVGSSPATQGTSDIQAARGRPVRSSPACAGNTRFALTTCTFMTLQPRVRGEHVSLKAEIMAEHASAPHARGTQAAWWWMEYYVAPTPRARGTPNQGLSRLPPRAPTPRARGTPHINLATSGGNAPAPRARGTLFLQPADP